MISRFYFPPGITSGQLERAFGWEPSLEKPRKKLKKVGQGPGQKERPLIKVPKMVIIASRRRPE